MSLTSRRPPNLLANFDSAIGNLNADSLALVLDFDGTLSEFVSVPEDAAIHPDALPELRQFAERLMLTAVVSGRAALDVQRRVGIEGVVYVGNHGAERIVDGVMTAESGATESEILLQYMLESLARAADDPGLAIENKRYSASLHYREASDESAVIERLKSALAGILDTAEFDIFWGNKLLEIRIRNGVNKGVALDWLIEKWRPSRVVFLGDDTTDADALQALQRRKASGAIDGIGIAVIQDGTPDSVFDSADYSLNGV
ncbi:MAG: trehalose-phosphatase, partial [Chloroflexi bacterium]|nr:trehalose-phosphatase [Chloroflexota bacterium]